MEMLTLQELASYLQRDVREVSKLANRGKLPGQKVSGEWRFSRTEVTQWLEAQLPSYDEKQLATLERGRNTTCEGELLITSVMDPERMAVPLMANTRSSVLREMVKLLGQTWQVYDADAILEAAIRRESADSTAFPGGVALPHPHRPLPNALEESMIAYGRTTKGIPFGAEMGGLTDIFFFVCCTDSQTHLKVITRLARLILQPSFVADLHEAETAVETLQVIEAAERNLVKSES